MGPAGLDVEIEGLVIFFFFAEELRDSALLFLDDSVSYLALFSSYCSLFIRQPAVS